VRTVAEHLVGPAADGAGSRLTLRLTQEGPLGVAIGWVYGSLTRRYLVWEADGFRRWCAQ
jgi:hypothetical protein